MTTMCACGHARRYHFGSRESGFGPCLHAHKLESGKYGASVCPCVQFRKEGDSSPAPS